MSRRRAALVGLAVLSAGCFGRPSVRPSAPESPRLAPDGTPVAETIAVPWTLALDPARMVDTPVGVAEHPWSVRPMAASGHVELFESPGYRRRAPSTPARLDASGTRVRTGATWVLDGDAPPGGARLQVATSVSSAAATLRAGIQWIEWAQSDHYRELDRFAALGTVGGGADEVRRLFEMESDASLEVGPRGAALLSSSRPMLSRACQDGLCGDTERLRGGTWRAGSGGELERVMGAEIVDVEQAGAITWALARRRERTSRRHRKDRALVAFDAEQRLVLSRTFGPGTELSLEWAGPDGACVWVRRGPRRGGERRCVALDGTDVAAPASPPEARLLTMADGRAFLRTRGQLVAFDPAGSRAWTVDLPGDPALVVVRRDALCVLLDRDERAPTVVLRCFTDGP